MLNYKQSNVRNNVGCGKGNCDAFDKSMDVFSLIKHSILTDNINPITKYFQLGRQVGSAGPEMIWKIFEAFRLGDKKEASVFVFEKRIADKLHKPRRRETVSEILRREIYQLERISHPNILSVLHGVEECHDSLAFAAEPVVGSLANILGNYDRLPSPVHQELKGHDFIEAEIKYGLLQITEALSFLHYSERKLHRNICPQSILITRRGCWRLGGMGFTEEIKEGKEIFSCHQWTSKIPKMAQSNLDYIAPEIQLEKTCGYLSDMFSFGMVICAIYNEGHSLINAEHQPSQYVRQLDEMHDQFGAIAHKMPLQLVDPVEKMINRDVRYRPSSQVFSTLRYFQDPVVASLQHLDVHDRNDITDKSEAYANLSQVIPNIPKKLLYKNVFPVLCYDCKTSENIVYALPALLTMIDFAPRDDYFDNILPEFRPIMSSNKPVMATVYILNKLDIILAKTPLEEIKTEVLPMVFSTLDSTSLQAQEAAIGAINSIKEYLDDSIIKKMVLPRAKSLFYRSTNVKLRVNALTCIDHMMESLDKMLILDEILPFLADISCQDAEVIMTLVGIYKHMLSDKRFGLTHNLIATKVMPSLIPHTVNPGLCVEQFTTLMNVLRDMLDQIDMQRMNKMKMETVTLAVPQRGSLKMQEDMSGDEGISATKGSPTTINTETYQQNKDSSNISKRNHSLQSLGMSLDEKCSCTLDKPSDIQRRHSLVPPSTGHPTISITTDDNNPDRPRRPSTHSLGPFSVSGFGEYHYRGPERPRRPSTHSVGILPISMFGEGGERPRRPSTHSLGVFCFGEDRDKYDRPRRPSTHSLGPLVVPDFGHMTESAPPDWLQGGKVSSAPSSCNSPSLELERRGSRGSIFGTLGIGSDVTFTGQRERRPSFQNFGESVMQLFSGK